MSLKKNELIAAANKFFQQGRWDKAVESYKKVLEIEPKNVNVYNMMGDSYLGAGDNANAYEAYQKAAEILVEQGLINKAIAIYKKLLRIYPDNCDIHEKLAACYVQSGLVGEANSVYLKIGEIYTKENKMQEALTAYKKIAELNPNNVLIRIKLAELFAKEGIVNEGIAEFLRIAESYRAQNQEDKLVQLLIRGKKVFPQSPEFYTRLADLCYEKDDFRGAIVELREAVKIKETVKSWTILARSAWKIQDDELLQESLDKLETLAPQNTSLKSLRALQAAASRNLPDAVAAMREAAEALIAEGNFTTAAADLEELRTLLGESPEVWQLYYQLYLAQDDKEHEIIEIATKLADHYQKTDQLDLAEKMHAQIFEKYPYRKDLRKTMAIPAAAKPEPTPVPSASAAGRSHTEMLEEASDLAQQGMFEEAEAMYRQVVANYPQNKDAYYQLGLVHKRLSKNQEATSDFLKYLTIDDQNVRVWTALGELYLESDSKDKAVNAFERALNLDSTLSSVLTHLEKLYRESGATEKLAQCQEKLRKLGGWEAPEDLEEVPSIVSTAGEEMMAEVADLAAAELSEEILETEESARAQAAEEISVEEMPAEISEETYTPLVAGAESAAEEEAAITPPQSESDITGIELETPLPAAAVSAEEITPASGEIEEAPVPSPISLEEAVAETESLEEFTEDYEKVQEALEQAKIFFNHHLFQKAIGECNKVLDLAPDNLEAQQILLQIKEKVVSKEEESKAQALADGSRMISTQEESILDQLIDEEFTTPVQSESELDNTSFDEIIADFKTGVIEDGEGEDYDNHFNLGLAFKDMGLFDEAIGEFQIAAKDENNYLRCCEMLGECYLEKGIYSLAIEELTNGLELATDFQDRLKFRYRLAIAYEKTGELDKAVELYQNVADEDRNFEQVTARLELAQKSRTKKNTGSARITYI